MVSEGRRGGARIRNRNLVPLNGEAAFIFGDWTLKFLL